jgi:hypothetical protein
MIISRDNLSLRQFDSYWGDPNRGAIYLILPLVISVTFVEVFGFEEKVRPQKELDSRRARSERPIQVPESRY